MPLPKPKKNESKDEFITRCMGNKSMQEEFEDNDQRLAVCNDLWEKNKYKRTKIDTEKRFFVVSELRTEPIDAMATRKKLVGHAAVFNSITDLGWFREKISPGAFKESIKEDDIRALFNHDSNFVLGRSSSGTLNLKEDKKGLAVEIDPPDTTWANDLLVSVERGDIKEMSFAFQVLEEKWDYASKGNETDLRTLIKAKLFDVSPVTFPAYADTDIALRSFEAWEEKQALKEAEAEARKKEAEQQKENKYKPDIEHYKRRLRIAEI